MSSAGQGNLADSGSALAGLVLVVDDEICIRTIAREILEGMGLTVLEAVDGQDGLDCFLAHREQINLVILDLVLPRLHGFQVMERIREVDPVTPILLSSGYSPEDWPKVLTMSPILGFLAKPYRSRDLRSHVQRLLSGGAP